jgi:hypothetical protein
VEGCRGIRAVSLVAGLALGACLLVSASASASGFVHTEEFGSAAQPSVAKPRALAVDPVSGDLLVVDVHEVSPTEFTGTISRYNPDGTAANFSALGTNVIDGEGSGPPCAPPSVECDGAPQHKLSFGFANPREVQIAIAPPGAAGGTEGDIYVTQPRNSLNLIDTFAPSGEYLGQLTASSEGAFGITTGVAVDPAGAVYVSDLTHAKIHKYAPAANPVTNANNTANFARTSAATLAAGAGSTGGSIFSAKFGSEPVKLNSSSGAEECKVSSGESLSLAVNRENGHLFSATESQVTEYEGTCAPEAEPRPGFSPGSGIRGIAVNGDAGLVYVSREGNPKIEVWEEVKVPTPTTLPPSPVGATSATLRGEVNPNGQPLSECFFEWGESTAYPNAAPCEAPDAAEVGAGSTPVAVHATIALEGGTTYHAQLVAGNANGSAEGGDVKFTTAGPQVRGTEAREVAATTAKIAANVDPNGEQSGFHVEYLSEAAYLSNPEADRFAGAARAPLTDRQLPATIEGTGNLEAGSATVTGVLASAGKFGVGDVIAGPGIPAETTVKAISPGELKLSQQASATATGAALTATGPEAVTQLISGLAPQTAYRFRVVAENGAAVTEGQAKRLLTAALPEAPETCPNAATRQGFAAALPDCRAYEMVSPTHKAGEVIPPEPSTQLGGSCSSLECLPGINNQPLPMQSSPSGEGVLYSGQPFASGLAALPNDYLSGRGAGGWSWESQSPPTMTGTWEAFSTDLSRGIAHQVEPTLAPAAPSRGGKGFANLYLRASGGTFEPLLSEEPPHRDPGFVNASANAFQIRYAGANAGTGAVGAFTHVLVEANDVLTAAVPLIAPEAPEPGEVGEECTLSPCDLYEWSGGGLALVNVLPGNAAAAGESAIGAGRLLGGVALYEAPDVDNAISADGSKVFWSSEETGHVYARIDANRTLEIPGPASCKGEVAKSQRACFLTASADGASVLLANGEIYALNGAGSAYEASADLTAGEGGFEGILGAAADLSRVYFLDSAALTGGEANAIGEEAEEGALNLYAWRTGGATRFIGRLVAEDNSFGTNGRYGAWHASPADRTAQVSPDGRYLAFMSKAPLSGYDNARSGGGTCKQLEVACFEVFEYAADTATLSCASCNPSGQRPVGQSNLSLLRPGFGSPQYRQPANLSPQGGGRLFFESQDALVPQDTNGAIQDVYEWEPQGVGGCAKAGGCVALISSGHSENDSMFMDASENGNDAFFITRQQLLAGDGDHQLDLFDARVNGGFPEAAAEAPCAGEACRGPLAEAPASPSAASQSFTGPGNPKPARKQKKAHRKKKKHKRAASHKRGGGIR